MKSGFKIKRRRKKREKSRGKKPQFFLCVCAFTRKEKKFINKKGLFYAKCFEFEEFYIVPFFCSSIQPQHTVSSLQDLSYSVITLAEAV